MLPIRSLERPHILTIVLIASLGALNLNILLPSLNEIARAFAVPYSYVQLMLSAYMALTGALQLVIGPLSDRYGRRPVLLISLSIFLVATLVCIYAPTIGVLLAARMVQATVIAGLVLSRAIVRDMVPLDQAASMLGYVTMGMTLVPMVSPAIGGYFANSFGWQANFAITLIFGGFVYLVCLLTLAETNKAPADSFTEQFRAWPQLLRSRRFWGFSFTATFGSGVFFSYLGGAPFVGSEILGMSPSELGYQFAYVGLGYMVGNFISGRYSTRLGAVNLMNAGAIVSASGAIVPMLLFWAGWQVPTAFFAPMLLVGLGNGMTLPSANAGMVSVAPHLAGAASGLGGAMTIGGGSIMSVIASAVLSRETGPYPLLAVMLASTILSFFASSYIRILDRQEADEE
ncbi:multidrug effflux MFS transporter [Rhizobium alvei]|uniref:Bcr/CflA family efflux transporter n=1 Tax=Rhizobium alvei TaxID=1132659 RepID=A0ABT8YHP1_9HYPH|nr:multidrug effflux MFS transporter [Rhizobium alvei]MDO6963212.1 multidrug effflux MFS transporter [Rhizobium alvei]